MSACSSNLTQNDPEGRARDEAFVQGLKELGWIESAQLADQPSLDRR